MPGAGMNPQPCGGPKSASAGPLETDKIKQPPEKRAAVSEGKSNECFPLLLLLGGDLFLGDDLLNDNFLNRLFSFSHMMCS